MLKYTDQQEREQSCSVTISLPSESPYFRIKKNDECLSMNMLAQSFIPACILVNAPMNWLIYLIGKKRKKSVSIDEHCSECPNQYRREKHARNVMQYFFFICFQSGHSINTCLIEQTNSYSIFAEKKIEKLEKSPVIDSVLTVDRSILLPIPIP
jgi:hypothetical protein